MAEDATQTEPPSRWRRISRVEVLLVFGQIALLASTRLFQPDAYTDDAYIHFRNALNWARGEGLVFNPGHWVLGTTSPVHAITLGVLHWATGVEFPVLATAMNFVLDVAIALLVILWLGRLEVPLGFRHALVALLALEPWRILYSVTGMEMSLFIFAIMGIVECLHHGRLVATGLLLGVLGWVRPEGAVVWLAVAASIAAERRWRELVRVFSVAVGVAVAFCIALLVAYGTFIPQSLAIKSAAPWYETYAGLSHVYMFITLGDLTPFYALTKFAATWGSLGDKINSLVVAGAQIMIMALGARFIWDRGQRRFAVIAGGFVTGYYLFYAATNPQIMYWYFVPYFFFSLLLAGLGWWFLIDGLAGAANRRWRDRPALARATRVAAASILFALWLASLSHNARVSGFAGERFVSSLRFRIKRPPAEAREVHYVYAGAMMNELLDGEPNTTVGMTEIGILGYYFRGQVLDAYGLVSPEVIDVTLPEVEATLPADAREFPFSCFMVFQPDYIISAPMFVKDPPASFFDLYTETRLPGIELRFFVREDLFDSFDTSVMLAHAPPEYAPEREDIGDGRSPTRNP